MSRRLQLLAAVSLLLVTCGRVAATAGADELEANWEMLDAGSLTFLAVQAGAPFEGRFERFQARIRFYPQRLEDSRFLVEVDLASVATGYGERDEILRGPEFFAVAKDAQALYRADAFQRESGGHYSAQGRLRLNGKDVPTALTFSFEPEAGSDSVWILQGMARINRLDFDLGRGDWSDKKWIGHEVAVSFRLRLGRIPD